MVNVSIKRASRMAGTSLLILSAAALVACGGGGGAEDSALSSARSQELQSPGPVPCTDSDVTGLSAAGLPALHSCTFNSNPPPSTCQAAYPGLLVREVRVVVGENKIEDETGVIPALPSWLGITLNATNNVLAWTSTDTATVDYQVVGVFLKNGNQTHHYDYFRHTAPGYTFPISGDARLLPPVVANPIFLYNVCYIIKRPTVVTGPAEWCSPGYWKNHTDSWAATGIGLTELYSAYYRLSTLDYKTTGRGCSTAPSSPTLFQAIDMPQCYGGPAANLVADLLSDNHPGINYQGTRVENCPLN